MSPLNSGLEFRREKKVLAKVLQRVHVTCKRFNPYCGGGEGGEELSNATHMLVKKCRLFIQI